jgi:HEAT repeat protein
MTRRIPLLIGLFAIAAVAVVSVYLMTHPAESVTRVPNVVDSAARPTPIAARQPDAAAVPVSVTTSPHTVDQWIADTASGDAAKRAAAITALAEAPRAQAVPVLARILTDGEPLVDRPLALQSLRDLALNQGDADGAIRDAVRHVIYHGDDFTKAGDAQEVLDIIEESQQGQ